MDIRKATVDDIETLVKIRLDYLRHDFGGIAPEHESAIKKQLPDYFYRHIITGDFIAMLASINSKVCASAFMVITEKPANQAFINGMTATILNVLTYREYRRQGIATRVMRSIIEEAKKADVTAIDLLATDNGRSLYERLGFNLGKNKAMRLLLSDYE